jgi:hypothetical protein
MRIYVASSWRNVLQPSLVAFLRSSERAWDVYDYREPVAAFDWMDIDPDWQRWAPEDFRRGVEHPLARRGHEADMGALIGCDACVLVTPCGNDAHLELGIAAGMNKATCVLLSEGFKPSLMYRSAQKLALDAPEVLAWLRDVERTREVMGRTRWAR